MKTVKVKVIPGQTCWAIDVAKADVEYYAGYMTLHKVVVDTLYINKTHISYWLKDYFTNSEWGEEIHEDFVFATQTEAIKSFAKLSLIKQKTDNE